MVSKATILIPAVIGLSLAADLAQASKPVNGPPIKGPPVTVPVTPARPVVIKAPEIDATAGVQAIGLLTGLVLLVGERTRRRRG